MQKILLTGGTGFLGSQLLAKLSGVCSFVVLKRSFSDLKRLEKAGDVLRQPHIKFYDVDTVSLEEIFKKEKIDALLHCATNYGRDDDDPLEVVSTNFMMPLTLLNLCKKHHVSRFINFDTMLNKELNYYSLAKNNFKDWLHMYSDDMACVNIAVAYFYGPHDDKKKFIPFIINEMMCNAKEINLTLGNQKRDFIYIEDVVSGFLKIFESTEGLRKAYHHFEIGTGQQTKIKDLVLLIQQITGNSATILNFGKLPYRKNEVMELKVDTTSLENLGWQHRYSLKDGLLKTIQEEARS